MNRKVKIGNKGGLVTITDKYYVASGGEANIYVNGNMVYKLYHDPTKKTLPIQKIQELSQINSPQVVRPLDVIYDAKTGEPLGYTTNYVQNAEPLLKLFTKIYKQTNNVSPQMIAELVKELQKVTIDVHNARCLIVDFNELNVLFNLGKTIQPWFIDTDSYATPSFKATAIMDSVRDRRVSSVDKHGKLVYNPDEMSDWFSWGILSFWLYTNIHPYRGNHKDYKPKDKGKQMDDGISVFHNGVRVPPTVNDFNLIPQRHLDWFKDVFLNNNRSVPPFADSIVPLTVPNTIVIVKGTNKIDVSEVAAFPEDIIDVVEHMGVNYVIAKKHVYSNGRPLTEYNKDSKKTCIVPTADGTMVMGTLRGNTVTFTELNTDRVIDTASSIGMIVRNNVIYTMFNGKLIENRFVSLNNKVVNRVTEIENVTNLTATMYDGCVLQDLLGKWHLSVPFAVGKCLTKYVPQLDGYRIVGCKSDKWVTVILGEKGGQYDRFVIVFKKDYSDFDIRKIEDVNYGTINFAVLDVGLCALLNDDAELELFVNNQQVEVLDDPPFDSTMKMFTSNNKFYFLNGNSIHLIRKK